MKIFTHIDFNYDGYSEDALYIDGELYIKSSFHTQERIPSFIKSVRYAGGDIEVYKGRCINKNINQHVNTSNYIPQNLKEFEYKLSVEDNRDKKINEILS